MIFVEIGITVTRYANLVEKKETLVVSDFLLPAVWLYECKTVFGRR